VLPADLDPTDGKGHAPANMTESQANYESFAQLQSTSNRLGCNCCLLCGVQVVTSPGHRLYCPAQVPGTTQAAAKAENRRRVAFEWRQSPFAVWSTAN
jgi:hypothetical protein